MWTKAIREFRVHLKGNIIFFEQILYFWHRILKLQTPRSKFEQKDIQQMIFVAKMLENV